MQTGAWQWKMTNVISVFRLAIFQQNDFALAKSNPCDFLCVRLWSGGEASDHSEGTERGRRGLPSHGTADGTSEACAGTPKIKSRKSFELSEAGSVVESLNNWATTNSTSSLPYASWKLNADGKPELDLGEMDTW